MMLKHQAVEACEALLEKARRDLRSAMEQTSVHMTGIKPPALLDAVQAYIRAHHMLEAARAEARETTRHG